MRFRKTMALQWVCLIGIMIPAMAMGGSESATVPLSDEPVRVNTEKAAQSVVIYSPPLPVLYWHLSKPAPCSIELSLSDIGW